MSQPTIISIIEKYSTGGLLSPEEQRMLTDWLRDVTPEAFHATLNACQGLPAALIQRPMISPGFIAKLERSMEVADAADAAAASPDLPDMTGMLFDVASTSEIGELNVDYDKAGPVVRPLWWKWSGVAAAVVILLGPFVWLWVSHTKTGRQPVVAAVHNDVHPGKNGAILTLADGKQVVLDSVGNDFAAAQGGTTIRKDAADRLTYAAGAGGTMLYNTLSTPKGRKISVVLADGTKVWLNAASSIRYPTAFEGTQRVVEISGEAYFEVAANASKPFLVKKMGSDYTIQVLGTSFNINAYDDEEAVRTTLLQGSVRVVSKNAKQMLQPGQQAVTANGQSNSLVLSNVNTTEVLAWKNGLFHFDRADIQTVMRQIARWYDVEVEYKGTIGRHFGGTISRDADASQVLKMLELTGAVKFNIQGKKIVVMPAFSYP